MEFEQWLRENTSLLERSVIMYGRTIRRFNRDYKELTLENINKFVSNSFRNKNSCYVKFAFKHYLVFKNKENLYEKIVKVKVNPRKKEGTYTDQKKIVSIINDIDNNTFKVIALIQNLTGCRASDIISFSRDNISVESDGGLRLNLITKGNKKKPVFISKDYTNTITYFMNNPPKKYPFLTVHSDTLVKSIDSTYKRYYEAIKESAIKNKMPKFSTHDFRRNFIDDAYKKTKDLNTVKMMAGHSRIETTLRYFNQRFDADKIKETTKAIR